VEAFSTLAHAPGRRGAVYRHLRTPWRRALSTAVSPGPRAPELSPGLRSLDDLGDGALAQRVGFGDARAFEVLYDRHRIEVSRYCIAILRHRQDAEEALQLTMLAAYRALSTGSPPRVAFRPWLFRIAHNECMDLLRARPRVEELTDRHDPVAGALHERMEARERLRELSDDIASLPLRQRAAFVMHELTGLPHAAVGEAIGTSALGARQLLHEARTTLEEFRAGRGLDCADVRMRIGSGDRRILRSRSISAHLRGCEPCRAAGAAASVPRPLTRRLVLATATAVVAVAMVAAGVHAFAAGSPDAPSTDAVSAARTHALPAPVLAPPPGAPAAAPAPPPVDEALPGGPPAPPPTIQAVPVEPVEVPAAPAPAPAPPPAVEPLAPVDPVTGEPSGLATTPPVPSTEPTPAPTPNTKGGGYPQTPAPEPTEPTEPTPTPEPGAGEEVPGEPAPAPAPVPAAPEETPPAAEAPAG